MFKVSEGFTVLAAEEHRGIIYLVSVKMIDDEWNTEIGCYPYPNQWIDGTDGFTDQYGPLLNYSTDSASRDRVIMRTPLYGYHDKSQIKLIIDDAFDESANLYLCDGENMDKAVNTGFRIDGSLNDFIYTADDFEGKINHVLYSLNPVVVDSVDTPRGGILKPGQYHIFFAYKTASFDKTEYTTESFPISLAFGESITDTFGQLDEDPNGDPNQTDKKTISTSLLE